MIVLSLDTALDRTAVALFDGARLAERRVATMDRGHAEQLFAMVEDLLAGAGRSLSDVGRIAVTIGPGSFTGIRIALGAARGLGLALDIPVVGIGTLPAFAASLPERAGGPVLAAIDARRGELYAQLFAPGGDALSDPIVGDGLAVLEAAGDDVAEIVGSGAAILTHAAATAGRRVPPALDLPGPDPLAVARLGLAADIAANPPSPLYLRPPDARPQAAMPGLFQ